MEAAMGAYGKIDIQKRYTLPDKVVYCKRCVIPNQRPRIVFDDEGVCSACRYWEKKKHRIDWGEREKRLIALCDRYRRSDGGYDVIVPSSGGKDSAYVAHQLKYRYDMNPLTVTWAPHVYTDIGRENFQGLINAGLDNVTATPNRPVHQKLTALCTEEMGEPFQPFIYGQVSYPLQVAIAYNVGLVMDGENGEAEYGGDPNTEESPGFAVQETNKFWFSGRPIDYWYEHGFTAKDLQLYKPPSAEQLSTHPVERHFFSYYQDWRPQKNYYYVSEFTGFKPNPDGRSEGTYSKYASLDDKIDPFHYYFSLLKFGYARATSDAAHEVREGLITREEAVALVHRYDTEFPSKNYQLFLDYCGFSEDQFWEICERWRNRQLWRKVNEKWELKQQVS